MTRAKLLAAIVFAAALLSVQGQALAATPIATRNADCLSCHAPGSMMSSAETAFDVSGVDYTRCNACHWISGHPEHATSDQCNACHASWPSRSDFYVAKVPVSTYGYFTSAASVTKSRDEIHTIHINGSWPRSVSTSASKCASCHASAACSACHAPASTHKEHSKTDAGTYTYPPVTSLVASGTVPGTLKDDSSASIPVTCTNSSCHDKAAVGSSVQVTTMQQNAFSLAPSAPSPWSIMTNAKASGGSLAYAKPAGASATIRVTGPATLELVGAKLNSGGKATVSLDGVALTTLDFYSSAQVFRTVMWSGSIGEGQHELVVTALGTKSAGYGTYVMIDALRVSRSVTPTKTFKPACDSCHGTTPHGDVAAIHEPTVTSAKVFAFVSHQLGSWEGTQQSCSTCHPTTNLVQVHGTDSRNCGVCHAPSGPRGSFVTWEKGCQQGDCHSASLHDMSIAQTAHTTAGNDPAQCNKCHEGNDYYYGSKRCNFWCHHNVPAPVGDSLPPATTANNAAVYKGSGSFTLTATDAGSGVKAIVSRVNGGAWTTVFDSLSTVAVSAEGTNTVEFYAVDAAGNIEPLKKVEPVVDNTAPTTTTDALTYYSNTATTIRMSVSDPAPGSGVANTYYSYDGGPFYLVDWVTKRDGFYLITDGSPHTLRLYSVDGVGNVESVKSWTYRCKESQAPATIMESQITSTTPAFLAWDNDGGSGVKAGYYSLDSGATWTQIVVDPPVTGSTQVRFAVPVPGEGTYSVRWYAVDNDGNVSSTGGNNITVDRTPPQFSCNAPAAAVGTTWVSLSAWDQQGMKYIYYRTAVGAPLTEIRATGGWTQSLSGGFYLNQPASGSTTYNVYAYAQDAAGNRTYFGPQDSVISAP